MIGDPSPVASRLSSKLTRVYCSTIAMANQGPKGGPPSMTSINEEEDEYDEKDVTIEVAIQKPVPAATSLPVNRV